LGLIAAIQTVSAAVVSRDWADGKLALKLDDGVAELEWLSPVSFRFSRTWEGPPPLLAKLPHEKIAPEFEEAGPTITMRTRFLTLELDRSDLRITARSGSNPVTGSLTAKTTAGAELRIRLAENERVFGLMGGNSGRLNLRGEKLDRDRGFFFTSAGWGMAMRTPASYDLTSGVISAPGASEIDYIFYYGPSAKEVIEQRAMFLPAAEVKAQALDLLQPDKLPAQATILPKNSVTSWEGLAALVRMLNQWSLSAVQYPALDLAVFDGAPGAVRERAKDLSTMLPIIYRGTGESGVDSAVRAEWTPYLTTYLREGFDRGYPVIRPLPMQFSKDANTDRQTDVFMLGDEVLLAPVVAPGGKRRLELPRGTWTDMRTNTEYPGSRAIEVDAPPGRVPAFVRNGWIVPLAVKDRMELHYFPSLGAEFFLWEPDLEENSQFHAAPAGDYVRVEIESKKRRTYEWILHHTGPGREIADESAAYTPVARRELLRPGTWWHDAALNNLHVMVRAEAGSDRIVNISY
jgi:hypothetical protein